MQGLFVFTYFWYNQNKETMKKYLLLIATVFSFTATFSQGHFYTAFGYNLGYAKLGGMNYVVGRYNETRSWLSDPMDKFSFPNGFCVSLGGSFNRIMIDLNWVGRHMTRTASGIQPANGLLGERQVKWRMNTFNFGFGGTIGEGSGGRINIGLSFDFGTEKTFTRFGEDGVFNPEEFETIQTELLMGSTVFMQFIISAGGIPGGLFIRPYFQFPYFKTDYGATSQSINSYTYQNDDIEEWESNSWNVGVQLQIGLFVRND